MKLLIYAINGRGLGHLNRSLVIAGGLRAFARKNKKPLEIRFLCESPAFKLVEHAGFKANKLPDRHAVDGFKLGAPVNDRIVAQAFDVWLRQWRPDMVLIDFSMNERLFRTVRAHGVKAGIIARELRPSTVQQAKKKTLAPLLNLVLIPHRAEDVPFSAYPSAWRPIARHLGHVAKTLDPSLVTGVRARYCSPSEKLVVVTIGGGGFEESYATLHAAQAAAQETDANLRWLLVYGPYYNRPLPADNGSVLHRKYEANLPELFAAADAVVCNAGYNTIQEVRKSGAPAIVIPLKQTGGDDQEARARAFAAEKRALIAGPTADEVLSCVKQIVYEQRVVKDAPETEEGPEQLGERVWAALHH